MREAEQEHGLEHAADHVGLAMLGSPQQGAPQVFDVGPEPFSSVCLPCSVEICPLRSQDVREVFCMASRQDGLLVIREPPRGELADHRIHIEATRLRFVEQRLRDEARHGSEVRLSDDQTRLPVEAAPEDREAFQRMAIAVTLHRVADPVDA